MSINAVIDSVSSLTERIKNLVPAYKAESLNETDKILEDNKAEKQAKELRKIKTRLDNICAAKKAVKTKKKAKSVKKAKIAKASRKRNRK